MAQNLGSNYSNNQKKERARSGGSGLRLLSFMVFVFVVVFLSYFGLIFGYKNFVASQIEKRDKEIADLATQVPKTELDEYLSFRFQLINLDKLLKDHVIASKVLPLLEANANQKVYYSEMNFQVKERRINLEGVAQSYEAVAEQFATLQRLKEIARYETNVAKSIEGGRVQFNASLFLKPEVLK